MPLSGLLFISVDPSPAAVKLLAEAFCLCAGLVAALVCQLGWSGRSACPRLHAVRVVYSRIPKIPKLVNFGIFGILGMCRVCVSHARSDYTNSENSKIMSISEFSEFGSCGPPPITPSTCFRFPTFGAHCLCQKRLRSVRVCELRPAQPCPNVL